MNISKDMKQILVDEILFAIKGIRSAQSVQEKVYYFSAVYSAANRVFNIQFDPELVLIHQSTQQAYLNIKGSSQLTKDDQMIPAIHQNLFEKLAIALEQLAEDVNTNTSTYASLQEIVLLGYSATGNGHYLMLKGQFKI